MSYQEIIGTLNYTPEMRFTVGGRTVCQFEMQTENGKVTCVAWGENGERIIELDLKMGREVGVAGSWKTRVWNGSDGTQRTVREFQVSRLVIR